MKVPMSWLREYAHVDALGREPLRELGPLELLLTCGDGSLDRLPDGVQRHPALLVPDLAQRELQGRLAAEVRDARVVELAERRRAGDRGERLPLQPLRIHGGDCIQRFLLLSSAGGTDGR